MSDGPDLLAVYGAALSTALASYMVWKDWWLRRPNVLVTVEKQVLPNGARHTSYYLVQAVNHSNRPVRVLRVYVDLSPSDPREPTRFDLPAPPVQLAGGGDAPAMSIGVMGATIPGTLGPGDAGWTWVPVDVIEPLLDGKPFVATAELSTGDRFHSHPNAVVKRWVVSDNDKGSST